MSIFCEPLPFIFFFLSYNLLMMDVVMLKIKGSGHFSLQAFTSIYEQFLDWLLIRHFHIPIKSDWLGGPLAMHDCLGLSKTWLPMLVLSLWPQMLWEDGYHAHFLSMLSWPPFFLVGLGVGGGTFELDYISHNMVSIVYIIIYVTKD